MKAVCFVLVISTLTAAVPTWPFNLERFNQRVDTIADRIDSGLQQALQPVVDAVDQLHSNLRETVNNLNRQQGILGAISGSKIWNGQFNIGGNNASPAKAPVPNSPSPSEGILQGLFDSQLRDWWKGPNVCIERQEIDESNTQNATLTTTTLSPLVEEEMEQVTVESSTNLDGDLNDEMAQRINGSSRTSRQFQSHVRVSSCNDEGLAYVCETKIRSNNVRKTYKTRYACCFGTMREAKEFGCHEVEVRSLQETVFALGGRSFLSLMKEAQVDEMLTQVNHTYFVPVDRSAPPSDDSANDVKTDEVLVHNLEDNNRRRREITYDESERQSRELKSTVFSHMVPGIYLTTDLRDEQVLATEDGDAKIRINMYNIPGRVYTANCVRLVSVNNYAQSGVVHMLDGVMKPATQTIAQLLSSEGFSSFQKLLGQQDWMKQLNQSGQFTVFAPSDEAFAKMDAEARDRLLKGQGCINSVVQHHVLPNVICSTVIQGRARSNTLLGTSLLLERDLEGKLYVNGKQVITRDVMATNGVLHVIDGVLIPENARSFSQLLSSRNLTELARLVDAAGMTGMLDSLTNATLFAPNNDAIRALPDEVKQSWIRNPERLKQVMLNHLVQPQIFHSSLSDNQLINTDLDGQTLRVKLYQSMSFFNPVNHRSSVQCASVVRWEQEVCNGNINIVDRVLIPPEKSISQWLAGNRRFSIMTQLLRNTGLWESLDAQGTFTVMAATDIAFYQLPEEELSEMIKDSAKAALVLRQHILSEPICCAGFRGDWFTGNRHKTIDGNTISLYRRLDGHHTVGDAQVSACDQLASNGIIHIIDQVLMPKSSGLPFLSGTRRLGLPGMEFVFGTGK